MKKTTTILSVALALALAGGQYTAAQDYDDLYYSPKKAAQKKAQVQKKRQEAAAVPEYAAASEYQTSSVSTRPLQMDVDTYNRRTPSSATAEDEQEGTDFTYTRRIERYHNGDIIIDSNDDDLKELYYSTPSEQDINIYVINNIDPWDYTWSSWYRPSWRWNMSWNWGWNWAWADPWFYPSSWGWGPAWSWGPSWSWSWGWGPSWGWGGPAWGGPAWGPGPGHGPGHGNNWAFNPAGASRPHNPSHGSGARPADRRPGSNSAVSNRPGNNGRPTWSTVSGSHSARPGNAGHGFAGVRPGSSSNHNGGSAVKPSNNSRRGNNSGTSSSSGRYNSSNRSNSSNSSSSNHNYSSPSRNSGSFHSGGSNNSSRGGFSGGHGGSGGGAGRGRR